MIINPYLVQPSVPSYGTLTTAWIAATGETNLTILGALNTLESDLTTYGLTSKMKALYPFVGGTSTKHSYNFINTAQHQLSFNGGWTHSSTGVLPNGTNAYANTYLNPSTSLSLNNTSFGVYLRTNSDGQKGDIGSYDGATQTLIYVKLSNIYYLRINTYNYSGDTASNTNSTGFYVNTRTAANIQKAFKNNSLLVNGTYSSGALSTNNIYLGAHGIGVNQPTNYSDREQAFAFIGDGLTDTEATNFYTAVQAFQTTLGRQV